MLYFFLPPKIHKKCIELPGSFDKRNGLKHLCKAGAFQRFFIYELLYMFFLLFYLYLAYTIRIYGSFQQFRINKIIPVMRFCNANIRDMIFRIQDV